MALPLDAMLLPSETVLFRAHRKARTTIGWGLLAFLAISLSIWAVPVELANRIAWAIGVGAASALYVATFMPKAEIIVTDTRLLIRIGHLLVDESVTALQDIQKMRRGFREIEIIRRDGERLPVGGLPSLAELTDLIVELTDVDAPVILPPRLKIWSGIVLGLWLTGTCAGLLLLLLTVTGIGQPSCVDPCSTAPSPILVVSMLAAIIPGILLGGLGGLMLAVPMLRLALPVADTRKIFDATLSPPDSSTRFDRMAAKVTYLPARPSRRFASILYGEEV